VLVFSHSSLVGELTAVALSTLPDVQGVAHTSSFDEAAKHLHGMNPDVLVLYTRAASDASLEFAAHAVASGETMVLLIVARATGGHFAAAVKAGCTGYLLQSATLADLQRAIEVMCDGDAAFPAELVMDMAWRAKGAPGEHPALSPTELRVLAEMASGSTTDATAAALSMSVHTVRAHVRHVFTKLGVHSRLEAVAEARRLELIDP
jgi:DNA-binding NarL/FixJ family response regulator